MRESQSRLSGERSRQTLTNFAQADGCDFFPDHICDMLPHDEGNFLLACWFNQSLKGILVTKKQVLFRRLAFAVDRLNERCSAKHVWHDRVKISEVILRWSKWARQRKAILSECWKLSEPLDTSEFSE